MLHHDRISAKTFNLGLTFSRQFRQIATMKDEIREFFALNIAGGS